MPRKGATVVKQPHGGEIHVPPKGGPSPNPLGRPPRLLTDIVKELRAKGYERATPGAVSDVIETMLNVHDGEVKDIIQDEKAPLSLRIIAKGLRSKRGFEVMEKLLDRAHGKPTKAVDVNMVGGKIEPDKVEIELPGGLTLEL